MLFKTTELSQLLAIEFNTKNSYNLTVKRYQDFWSRFCALKVFSHGVWHGYRLQTHVVSIGSDELDVRLPVLKVYLIDNGLTSNIHDDQRESRRDFRIVSRRNAGGSGNKGKGSCRNTKNGKPIRVPFRSEWMT